jgi:hypothetical protein
MQQRPFLLILAQRRLRVCGEISHDAICGILYLQYTNGTIHDRNPRICGNHMIADILWSCEVCWALVMHTRIKPVL